MPGKGGRVSKKTGVVLGGKRGEPRRKDQRARRVKWNQRKPQGDGGGTGPTNKTGLNTG